jgi:hypothetical protein
MKTTTRVKRKKRTPVAPLPLKVSSLALTQTELNMLTDLCQSASDHLGRVISTSALTRALVRLAARGAIPLHALVDEIETEISQGRRWGHDAVKPIV